MEKKMENVMETGVIGFVGGILGFHCCFIVLSIWQALALH